MRLLDVDTECGFGSDVEVTSWLWTLCALRVCLRACFQRPPARIESSNRHAATRADDSAKPAVWCLVKGCYLIGGRKCRECLRFR